MKVNECDGVILCGGLGKRLQGVVGDVPKVMADVNGRPFLDIVVEHLKAQNIRRLVLCTGYKADRVEQHYRDHAVGIEIDFSREDKPLGTGGALKNARDKIASDPFFVFNGDSFVPADLQPFLDFHKEHQAAASLMVSRVSEGEDFGSLRLDDNNRVIDFHEKKGHSGQSAVNAGIYCFNKNVFPLMPDKPAFSLELDFFPKLAGKQLYGYHIAQKFWDIGTPERYRAAQKRLQKGK